MADPIPVVFCFDDSYANYAAVAAFSVLMHATAPVKLYCIAPKGSAQGVRKLRQVATRFGCEIREILADDSHFQGWKTRDHLKLPVYLRLLIPDLVDEKRVIYLDADLIVRDDLSALLATPFRDDAVLAGVVDMFDGSDTKISRAKGDPYLNVGVMVLELEKLRRDGFFRKCGEVRATYADSIVWPCQDIVNKYAEGRKIAVDRRWNRLVLPQRTGKDEWQTLIKGKDSAILHFVNSTKPWSAWCNPRVAEFWWGYARPIGLADLAPVPATNLRELMSLAKRLDEDLEFAEASRVKEQAIRLLMEHRGQGPGAGPRRQTRG